MEPMFSKLIALNIAPLIVTSCFLKKSSNRALLWSITPIIVAYKGPTRVFLMDSTVSYATTKLVYLSFVALISIISPASKTTVLLQSMNPEVDALALPNGVVLSTSFGSQELLTKAVLANKELIGMFISLECEVQHLAHSSFKLEVVTSLWPRLQLRDQLLIFTIYVEISASWSEITLNGVAVAEVIAPAIDPLIGFTRLVLSKPITANVAVREEFIERLHLSLVFLCATIKLEVCQSFADPTSAIPPGSMPIVFLEFMIPKVNTATLSYAVVLGFSSSARELSNEMSSDWPFDFVALVSHTS
ncbi:hypothetical protein Nepgr_017949 [Nepenthes gracilis]|uniref:Uncharacterized protein n=1 Tax=Nepenthes gracilis TaxID=150966 RepID=A0AAD3XSZ8_NEPGR|nr:hypothetical protein Nepgr_017949 [Nepenthes gracilis]